MRKTTDFNSLLKAANLIVAGLITFSLVQGQSAEYVNQETLVLGLLLCAQTHLVLVLERKRRDPFVLLLTFEMICYYALRIYTLTLYPLSLVFSRYPFDSSDLNHALIFILVANVALYSGLYFVRGVVESVRNAAWTATFPSRVVFLIIAAIVFDYLLSNYWTESNVPRALDFLTLFLTANIVGLMALAYYFVLRGSLSRKFAVSIAVLIVLEMALHTLFGSRSAIVGLVQNFLIVLLAVFGCIRVPRRYLWLGLASLPIVIVLLVASFAISTFNRASREVGASFDVSRAIATAGESAADLSLGPDFDVLLPQIFARAGFLDFSAEIIAHRDEYKSVINPSVYAESIVDNVLTPGFDVFDQPLIAQSLQFIYGDAGAPSKVRLPENYQSDQLGIYGEFYALAGYGCLPLLFLIAFGLKRAYLRVHDPRPFRLAMKRIIVLSVFVQTVRSFGLDWIILETIPLVAAMYLYGSFFTSRHLPVQPATVEGVALP